MVVQKTFNVNKEFTTENAVNHIKKAIIHEIIDKVPSEEGVHVAYVAADKGTKIKSLDELVQFVQDTVDAQIKKCNEQNLVVKDSYTDLVKATWKFLVDL